MNKMFKKILAVTAVAATAACMSVSAFAADYTPDDNAITISPTAVTADQYTVMLFKYSDTVTTEAIADETLAAATPDVADIYYINQGTDLTALTTGMLVKATTVTNDDSTTTTTYLPVGTYIARVGNSTGSVENIQLTVDEETITILYGDVNNNGKVNALDVRDIRRYLASWDGYDETTLNLEAADVNGNGKVNALDVRDIRRYLASWDGYETLPIK